MLWLPPRDLVHPPVKGVARPTTANEVSQFLDIAAEHVLEVWSLSETISLDKPTGPDNEATLADFIEDYTWSPDSSTSGQQMSSEDWKKNLNEALSFVE